MSKILFVGAGASNASTVYHLGKLLDKVGDSGVRNIRMKMWEVCAEVGGRMKTSVSADVHGLSADMGAQYISHDKSMGEQRISSIYDMLIKDGILAPMTINIENSKLGGSCSNFVAPNGTSSIVKYLMDKGCVEITCNKKLTSLEVMTSDPNFRRWLATDSVGNTEAFDIVVLSLPVPEILKLKGSDIFSPELRRVLRGVEYTMRYAVALFYNELDIGDVLPWAARYVYSSECVRFVCVDTVKRGVQQQSTGGSSVVIHCTVPFSVRHMDTGIGEVRDMIMREVYAVVPELGACHEALSEAPLCHRWVYSQVRRGSGVGGEGAVLASRPTDPPLVLCGDAFTRSSLDGCLLSGVHAAHILHRHLS